MHQLRRTQFREILRHGRLPSFLACHVLGAAMGKIERPRFLDAAEKHERVRTVSVEPEAVGGEGDDLVGRIERV